MLSAKARKPSRVRVQQWQKNTQETFLKKEAAINYIKTGRGRVRPATSTRGRRFAVFEALLRSEVRRSHELFEVIEVVGPCGERAHQFLAYGFDFE